MTEPALPDKSPIFVIGSHRSGTSAVTGLLHRAGGMALGELMPPTPDNPRGYFETMGVVDAHRDILKQLDLDWTCPPPDFDPAAIDLSRLREQVAIHQQLPLPWGMKDPRSMFMLKAWAAVGVSRVRFVGVLRPEADIIRSLTRRDGMDQLEAESIVTAHLHRMNEIASLTRLPIVEFSNDAASVLDQTRRVASALGLDWDEQSAQDLFEPTLVRNRASSGDQSTVYQSLIGQSDLDETNAACDITSLSFDSRFPDTLNAYIGPRNGGRRNELWSIATFGLTSAPRVVEFIPRGARSGRQSRPGVQLDVVEIDHPLQVGFALRKSHPTNGIVSSGLLDSLNGSDLETFLQEAYLYTDQLTEAVFDIVDPADGVPVVLQEASVPGPSLEELRDAAENAGWNVLFERRVSPHRVGVKLRKRILTDSALVPVVTELLATAERVRDLDGVVEHEVARQLKHQSGTTLDGPSLPADAEGGDSLVERAESAERELARLKNRRSVRFALWLARPFKGLFRGVRRWR